MEFRNPPRRSFAFDLAGGERARRTADRRSRWLGSNDWRSFPRWDRPTDRSHPSATYPSRPRIRSRPSAGLPGPADNRRRLAARRGAGRGFTAGRRVGRASGRARGKGSSLLACAEFLQALQTLSKSLDARVGDSSFTQALIDGVQAFREADDFAASGSKLLADVDSASLVARHRTPVLKNAAVSRLPAVMAMQQYYAYAQDRLVRSCANAPVASQAFWGLGRVYSALAAQSPQGERLNSPRAIALYQVALAIDAGNYRAANELGVLLARFGQLRESRDVLRQSVATGAMPETWHNLAVVHARLGESELAVLRGTS